MAADTRLSYLKDYLSHLPMGAALLDGQEFFMNETATSIHGYTNEEITSIDDWFRILCRERAESTLEVYLQHKRKGFPELVTVPFYRKDGSRGWADISAGFLGTAELWLFSDVTERVKSEHELEKAKAMLQEVVANLPLALFCKDYDHEGQFVMWNKQAIETWGLNPDETHGKTDFDIFPKDQAVWFQQKDRETLATGKQVFIEEEPVDSPTVGQVWVRTWKVPLQDRDGHPRYLLGISQDITRERKLRKEIQEERSRTLHAARMAGLGEMAAGLAHEVNNPLAIMEGYLKKLREELQEKKVNGEASRHLEKVEMGLTRVSNLIRGLVQYSREDRDHSHHKLPMEEVIRETLNFCRERFKAHNIRLEVPAMKEENFVHGHRVQLSQVLLNLLNNAHNAVEKLENRWVRIELFREKGKVQVAVSDSGPGIPEENRERIMEPFFTTKPEGQGTGLGLSVAKGIVESHDGTLYLDEKSPHTRFVMEFPVWTESAREVDQQPRQHTR